jgi:hypothetical protein
MPTASEIAAAVEEMVEEDPIVMAMLSEDERQALAAAALRGAETARAKAAEIEGQDVAIIIDAEPPR